MKEIYKNHQINLLNKIFIDMKNIFNKKVRFRNMTHENLNLCITTYKLLTENQNFLTFLEVLLVKLFPSNAIVKCQHIDFVY